MRERLIRLLQEAEGQTAYCDGDDAYGVAADYLLDNGVIVPSVRVGQTVWLIRHNPYEGYVIKKNKAVNIGMCFSKNSEVCVTVVTTKEDILGKTVFLTREAAEAALKARENK